MSSEFKLKNKAELKSKHIASNVISDTVCPECGNNLNTIYDKAQGEIICGNCGLIILDHLIDQGPEWRTYENIETKKRARTGSPGNLVIHDKGLSTIIDWQDKDIYGQKLLPQKRGQIYRLRRLQILIPLHSSIAMNLKKAMRELDRLASQMDISSSIKEIAAFTYRKALNGNYLKGRKIIPLIAASIYIAWRICKIPRALEEITNYTSVNKKIIARNYRYLAKCLKLKIPMITPLFYIDKFCEELQLSPQTRNEACRIIQLAKHKDLTSGKDPRGLAAAVIYIAGILRDEHCTQRDISRVSQITEVTIRNRYKEIVKKLKLS